MPKDASLKNKIHVGVGSVSDRVLVEPGAVCPMQAEGKFTVFLQGMYWAEAANSLSVVRPPLVLLMGSSWRSLVCVRPPWLCGDFQGDFSCWVCAESFTWPWLAGGGVALWMNLDVVVTALFGSGSQSAIGVKFALTPSACGFLFTSSDFRRPLPDLLEITFHLSVCEHLHTWMSDVLHHLICVC